MAPGSTYRPATLQPPCLGREPRLGLRHFGYGKLGILLEIELLVSGEHIFQLVVVGRLDELSHYSARWLS
jgi:hypothetical protein